MSDSLSRRAFLQTTAALATAAAVAPALALPAPGAEGTKELPYPENGTLIPDDGWHLWVDSHAPWMQDDIFLPEDIAWIGEGKDARLCAKGHPLPANAPTGGWAALTSAAGKAVMLPTTVEQHFWGKYGAGTDGKPRPYTPEEYRYAAPAPSPTDASSRPERSAVERPAVVVAQPPADDNIPQNGAYFGVSWFYRPLTIPAEMRGKRIFLHVRGAHLRAEVYLNGQLCGYSIMEELPFDADLTHAAKPGGENLLAIRITNPFGRYDWVDGLNAKWGKVNLYRSHGFGGLDRGITISAHHEHLRIKDLWVLNRPNPKQVYVRYEFSGAHPEGADFDSMRLQIIEPISKRILHDHTSSTNPGTATCCDTVIDPKTGKPEIGPTISGESPITCEAADLWTLDKPHIYHLRMTISTKNGRSDTRTIAFGFRSFGPTGLGSNAMFRLNGRRIRNYTSISWGFWGLNGMWPVPELAEKEVVAAKTLGLNCLNFHRNLAKEDVLRAGDRLGLLRYMEPGAGKMAIGKLPSGAQANAASIVMEKPTSEADKFAQRFMFTKCVEMVKAFRSHPSVIEYCLQNEIGADLNNPDTIAVLKAMHDEDPSRCVVLNDGFVAPPRRAAQAWYEPWSDTLHRSDKEPWGGWWNQHQGAGDQWYDDFYKSPDKFTYKAPFKEVLTEYGEMEGCARPDVHGLNVHQITDTYKKYGGVSYDLQDHEEILAGYNKFLDRWGFRKAFPTPDALFLAVGRTCYESWQNYMENARLSDELDFAAISGWESTSIENHSGIVDNLRNFKSDPKLIAGSLLPIRPIAKQHSLCVAQGQPATFDLFLANDTPHSATGTLTFSMITPSGNRSVLLTLPAPAQTPDQFTYLLKSAFQTPPFAEAGLYRFKFDISSHPLAAQTKELWVSSRISHGAFGRSSSDTGAEPQTLRVGVSGIAPSLRKQFAGDHRYTLSDFTPGGRYDLIISAGLTAHVAKEGPIGETTGESMPVMNPGHTPEPGETATTTQLGQINAAILEAVRTGTPLLAIPQADTLSEGVALQLAAAGAFTYNGTVGDFRAPWMGNWYFVREHPLFDGMPVNQALGGFYQAKGRQSNGLLVDGPNVEVVVGYSRDHDRRVGAGTFTTRLGKGKIVFHRCPDFHPVLQQRFLANAIAWLTSTTQAVTVR